MQRCAHCDRPATCQVTTREASGRATDVHYCDQHARKLRPDPEEVLRVHAPRPTMKSFREQLAKADSAQAGPSPDEIFKAMQSLAQANAARRCGSCGAEPSALVHVSERSGGQVIERHLCAKCAAEVEPVPDKAMLRPAYPEVEALLDAMDELWQTHGREPTSQEMHDLLNRVRWE